MQFKDDEWHRPKILALQNEKSALQETRDVYPYSLTCPMSESVSFVAGSLDSSTILSLDSRRTILDVYGRSSFPDKQYHTMAGMSLGCSLARCGISETETKLIQAEAAGFYRGIRLCKHIRSLEHRGNLLKKYDALSYEGLKSLIKRGDPQIMRELKNSGICAGVAKCWSMENDSSLRLPSDDAFINHVISSIDAAQMFKQGWRTPTLPCTFSNYSGPKLGSEDVMRGNLLDRILYKNGCRQNEWSQDRCDKAAARLRTWEVDEYWTRAQQARGALFGLKQCRSTSISDDQVEAAACKVMEARSEKVEKSEATK